MAPLGITSKLMFNPIIPDTKQAINIKIGQ